MKKLICVLMMVVLFSCGKAPRPVLMDEFRSLAKLATTEFVFTKYFVINKDNKLFGLIKLGSAVAVMQSEASLKLGIDFSSLTEEQITIDKRSIRIVLPPLHVVAFDYPIEKFILLEKYSDPERKRKIIHSEDWDAFYRDSQSVLQEHINHLNVLPEAQTRTKALLKSHLRQLGYQNIVIEFQESQEPLFAL